MKKRKIQSGKSVDEKSTDSIEKLTGRIDGLDTNVKKLTGRVDEVTSVVLDLNHDVTVLKRYVMENMYTKKDHERFMALLDPIMLTVRNTDRVNILTGKQLCDMDDKLEKHGQRIAVLEKRVL